jgi:hypothetical protein
MRLIHTLLLMLLIGQAILAQVQSTGLVCSDERYQALNLLPTYSGTKYNEVPLRVSLKRYCPVPGDQQELESCVGWAVGYGALTILKAQREGLTEPDEITAVAHSAAFVYNQIKAAESDCQSGAFIEDALHLLRTAGDCLEASFNYSEATCEAQPSDQHHAEAAGYRIQDFAAVFELQEPEKSKLAKVCKILATETPLVVGMALPASFQTIRPGTQVWDAAAEEPIVDYHAMVLVGYDNVSKQVELLNSFGTSWGRNGFIKMPYDDFARLCRYAYVLIPDYQMAATAAAPSAAGVTDPSAAERLSLTGEFVFRRPAGYLTLADGQEIPYFEEVATRWQTAQGYYTTADPYFPVGEVFQLVARNIPRGRYVYVFSQSPDERINVHFPKTFSATKTAGFVLEKTVEIVIPNEEMVLQLPKPGQDFLCILYSNGAIPDFEQRIARMDGGAGDFATRFQAAFGDVLVPAEQISYEPQRMSFAAHSTAQAAQKAVHILLRVEAQ